MLGVGIDALGIHNFLMGKCGVLHGYQTLGRRGMLVKVALRVRNASAFFNVVIHGLVEIVLSPSYALTLSYIHHFIE